ncbi:ABC transporter permease [Oscillospiraceae bacterium MB08-C2-2]|nr:ABC transporter permease [Oscillospiraceae bacterium MB08-C2-2]
MLKFIIRRLFMLVPVVLGITLFIFIIMDIAPGDPARTILGAEATVEEVEALREEMGLNDPLLVRYVTYLGNLVRGDFGQSWYSNFDVLTEFSSRLPNTLALGTMAFAIAAILGIPIGIMAAVRQYHIVDYTSLVLAMVLSAMPAFWFGLMSQVYFALKLGMFPATGTGSLAHFILPACTLAAGQMATQVRMTRSSMLEIIKQDYVRTARSKGANETQIITRHVLRNGLLPVVTQLGISYAGLISGSVVTESVFSISGIGSFLINAVKIRDVPIVMGVLVIISIFVGVVNLLVDLLYAVIDPRVKLGFES